MLCLAVKGERCHFYFTDLSPPVTPYNMMWWSVVVTPALSTVPQELYLQASEMTSASDQFVWVKQLKINSSSGSDCKNDGTKSLTSKVHRQKESHFLTNLTASFHSSSQNTNQMLSHTKLQRAVSQAYAITSVAKMLPFMSASQARAICSIPSQGYSVKRAMLLFLFWHHQSHCALSQEFCIIRLRLQCSINGCFRNAHSPTI